MAWLPCIRRGSQRWWLPRSLDATDAIIRLLLSKERSQAIPRSLVDHLSGVIQRDAPLLIFCAVHIDASQVEVTDLARWLIDHATGCFANGDAYLGFEPPQIDVAKQTQKLSDHFRTLPVDLWMNDASLWLETFGPPVPVAWQQQWPTVVAPTNGAVQSLSADVEGDSLQQLARQVEQHRSLERSFDERLHKNKLGAVKQLAYGLSHEINNPLANISTRAQQLQKDEKDPARVATLQRIIDQVYRAHEMIADLMFYANPPQAQAKPVDVVAEIRRVVDSFREETKRQTIRLEVSLPEDPIELTVDRLMIGEALRVLIRNAVDAIGCQGTIVVSVVQDSDMVRIHVADSGPGLSSEARQHAFDPYYSGREAGRGLGLGLCRAYRIARLHQADITLAGGPAGCVATLSLKRHA
ncbi:Sensor protein ZraS [Rubripirellula amarantea]|uniref:histidine kinase n=2 Tax=Rubripirellula amarantea TaxID=2527999 RepID=A0A5C5WQN1_9BACT|nr:Sensor protein ZraS [Rubripirellula amarantea]